MKTERKKLRTIADSRRERECVCARAPPVLLLCKAGVNRDLPVQNLGNVLLFFVPLPVLSSPHLGNSAMQMNGLCMRLIITSSMIITNVLLVLFQLNSSMNTK
jgi:hypothetical protein